MLAKKYGPLTAEAASDSLPDLQGRQGQAGHPPRLALLQETMLLALLQMLRHGAPYADLLMRREDSCVQWKGEAPDVRSLAAPLKVNYCRKLCPKLAKCVSLHQRSCLRQLLVTKMEICSVFATGPRCRMLKRLVVRLHQALRTRT